MCLTSTIDKILAMVYLVVFCCWVRLTKFSEVLQSVVYDQNKVLLLQMSFLQQPWMMSKSVGVFTGMLTLTFLKPI